MRAVISDFGGVLTSSLDSTYAAMEERAGITVEQFQQAMMHAAEEHGGRHPLYELEEGRIDQDEFLDRVQRHAQGLKLDGLRHVYHESHLPNERMIDFLRELKGRALALALVANAAPEWEPHWRAKIPDMDQLFDAVVFSGQIGIRKPNPRMYKIVLERLGSPPPDQCLYVDDQEPNCESARQLGITAVHFKDTEQAIAELEGALGAPV
jgi:putative hydrolase of the HAD superfamily